MSQSPTTRVSNLLPGDAFKIPGSDTAYQLIKNIGGTICELLYATSDTPISVAGITTRSLKGDMEVTKLSPREEI